MKQKQLLEVFHLQASTLFVPTSSLLQHWGLGMMDRGTLASPFLHIPPREGKRHKGQLSQEGKSLSAKNEPCKIPVKVAPDLHNRTKRLPSAKLCFPQDEASVSSCSESPACPAALCPAGATTSEHNSEHE